MSRLVLLAALTTVGLGVPGAAAAQAREDSTAIRVRERLERLARPPAPDTASPVGADTVLVATPVGPGPAPLPGGAASGDTVLARLLQLEGFDPTRYEGTSATFEAGERVLVLHGDSTARATVRREGMELTADSVIRFDEGAGLIRAEGEPLFSPREGDPVESRVIVYDLEAERGSALDARTRYSSGANWIVTGDLPAVSPEVVYGSHARFTSCELEVPHYHFETDEIKIVNGSILVARPVRLYFADVPVAWLPFVAQSLSSGRASGLLTPAFSVNDIVRTSGGYNRRISNLGFYWAMSDYADATVAFDWFSENYTALTGAFRYSWLRQFLNGNVNVRQYWQGEGGTELSLDSNHNWEPDERTRLRIDARYASTTDFVRRYSTNPREVVQKIRSSGGLDRRFDWGSFSLSSSREQDLSDDEVTMTLPDVSLSLTPITLFGAPPTRASWYNNVTWSGRTNVNRQITDYPEVSLDGDGPLRLDAGSLRGSVSSNFTMGNLAWRQSVNFDRASTFDVPALAGGVEVAEAFVGYSPGGRALLAPDASMAERVAADGQRHVREDRLGWQTSLSYQQTLIGSTTITPNLTWSGASFRSDTMALASSFVPEPTRLSFGASLKSDIYGFFGGVGPFQAIRHKITPEISYQWSPEKTPTELQEQVFGSRALLPTNAVRLTLNQTFEAKREPTTDAAVDSVPTRELLEPPTLETDSLGRPIGEPLVADTADPDAPRRQQQEQIVNLLSIRTDAVSYDFVEADTAGDFLLGFQTTQIGNTISSDFLRGLSIQIVHDLFRDTTIAPLGPSPEAGRERVERVFAPHLSRLNLGFSLNSRSALFRGFGLWGDDEADEVPIEPDLPEETEPFSGRPVANETTIIPGDPEGEDSDSAFAEPRTEADIGRWNANFSYALVRPRFDSQRASQMLQISFDLIPTEKWDLGWRTSYDLERGAFNDHMVSLTRDLHRWQASFDFQKTTTGNWTFRFEVSLLDNRDLKFDYRQRNVGTDGRRRDPS